VYLSLESLKKLETCPHKVFSKVSHVRSTSSKYSLIIAHKKKSIHWTSNYKKHTHTKREKKYINYKGSAASTSPPSETELHAWAKVKVSHIRIFISGKSDWKRVITERWVMRLSSNSNLLCIIQRLASQGVKHFSLKSKYL
jgi:hypothetical protein